MSAVKVFHTKHQRYPKSLEDLVPGFIDAVPVAKYTLGLNQFWYYSDEQYASLFYVALPPFGRLTYDFTRDEWGYTD